MNRLVNGLAHQESLVAQWLERPTDIWEAKGSIPIEDSDFFFPRSSQSEHCVVPENIHTPPTEGIGNSGEEGGLKDPKIWNFWRGGGVIGQIPSVGGGGGGYGYFLELHILSVSHK